MLFRSVSVGELPVVTGVFPLAVPADKETEVQLAGENLPPGASAKVKAGAMGEAVVPVNAEKFRARKEFKVLVSNTAEVNEVEPNDSPATATSMAVPGAVNGRLTLKVAARPLTPALSPAGGEGGEGVERSGRVGCESSGQFGAERADFRHRAAAFGRAGQRGLDGGAFPRVEFAEGVSGQFRVVRGELHGCLRFFQPQMEHRWNTDEEGVGRCALSRPTPSVFHLCPSVATGLRVAFAAAGF